MEGDIAIVLPLSRKSWREVNVDKGKLSLLIKCSDIFVRSVIQLSRSIYLSIESFVPLRIIFPIPDLTIMAFNFSENSKTKYQI